MPILLVIVASALAGPPVERSLQLAPDAIVSVDMTCGSLDVHGGSGGAARISARAVEADAVEIVGASSRLVIDLTDYRAGCADVTLTIPEGATLEVDAGAANVTVSGMRGSVELATLSGNVTVRGGRRSVEIETISGSVYVEGPLPRVEIASVSGSCTARSVGPEVRIESVSGAIDISAGVPLAQLAAATVSGPIRVDGRLARTVRAAVESHSGQIAVRIPADTDVEVTVDSFSGRIQNRLGAPTPEEVEAQGELEISTFSGDITLDPLLDGPSVADGRVPDPPPPPLPPPPAPNPPR